ncbi:hypothetical protein BpHYR1_028574 [Brachionus plicatilis]|uniref:Uncharacterized protein n=1 Tax=Brachionus plicatilis TaxID=10195 RepID=A0A3M7QTW9_BRAPC|nr:hypothetical protein BpHYR1_028574 [Brachionus plicatilis]
MSLLIFFFQEMFFSGFIKNFIFENKIDISIKNLLNFQVNLSIISPKYSIDWIKLFDRININSCDIKLDKIGNFNYLILLQNSIHLIDYEAQQQKLHQQQLIQQQAQQPVQVTAQPPSVPSVQEQYQIAQESVPSPAIAQQQLGYQQVSTQMAQSNLSNVQSIQGQQAQQSSQQQFIAQQKVIHQQTSQAGQGVSQIQQMNQNFVTIPPAQQIQTQQEMFSQQQLQQQQIISQPSPGQPNLMPRTTSNIGKQMSGQQAPQQPQGVTVISGQGPRPQIVQVQPIVRMGQPQGQQQSF